MGNKRTIKSELDIQLKATLATMILLRDFWMFNIQIIAKLHDFTKKVKIEILITSNAVILVWMQSMRNVPVHV